MSLFGDFAAEMRAQEGPGGSLPSEYAFSVGVIRRIRVMLVNKDSDDEESDFFLDQLKAPRDAQTVVLHTFITHHLYEYLQGADR